MQRQSWYSRFARKLSTLSGRPLSLGLAVFLVVAWLASGPVFGFSDTWQLFMNTATSIITFLMVFLIQNTQNRDTEAMQIKLDELLRATKGAHLALLDLEELDNKELDKFRARYTKLATEARDDLAAGRTDTDNREV